VDIFAMSNFIYRRNMLVEFEVVEKRKVGTLA